MIYAFIYCRKTYRNYQNETLEIRQYPPYYWSDKSFQGTIVNQALPSLHGITLTKPLTPLPFPYKRSPKLYILIKETMIPLVFFYQRKPPPPPLYSLLCCLTCLLKETPLSFYTAVIDKLRILDSAAAESFHFIII